MLEFIRENKLVATLLGSLALIVLGHGVRVLNSTPLQRTIIVTYQTGEFDTLSVPIRQPKLENSCLIDNFNGTQVVCGVRSIKIVD